MNLSDLARYANAGRIDALELISLEGGIYILDIYLQGQRHALVDERGSVCHLRSVEHARDLLRDLPELPFHLVQQTPYDEMCGLADGVREPLRVPIGMRSQW
ncbi:MAG: cation transporter [Pseudomonas sp.]|nr:cation transporter [Pseudomonas sp.]